MISGLSQTGDQTLSLTRHNIGQFGGGGDVRCDILCNIFFSLGEGVTSHPCHSSVSAPARVVQYWSCGGSTCGHTHRRRMMGGAALQLLVLLATGLRVCMKVSK